MNNPTFNINDYELFHNANLYLPSRTIYFGGQPYDEDVVTSQTVSTLIKNLHILEHREVAPISILLNTVGGSWEAGIAVYDVIKSLASPVIIVGMGQVYSMGSVIIQAAERRVLTENTYVMIHDGTECYDGDPKKIERWMEVSKAIRLKMYDIYWQKMKKKNKKLKFSDIEALCAVDTLYTAEEAVKVGLVDEIIEGR
jgi:ATP-dependent Clp protease, protease subunit